jgi:drug/metabolite transporter (DMT)-like permease
LLFFTCLDAFAKYSSGYVPAIEVAWVRFLGHALIGILALRPWRNFAAYRSRRPFLQLLRSLLLGASTVLNFLALHELQLAETTTIMFASAFVVAGLAGPALGEWIGPRRWAAIAVGFIGVIIVMRPGPSGIQPAIFYSIGAMFCGSGYNLLTRVLAPTDSAASMLLFPAVAASILVAPIALPIAVLPPTPFVAFTLAMTGVCGAVGHWCLIHGHRITPAAILAPFVYTQLLWMVAIGYLAFNDLPHDATLLGAAVIVGSGLYILYRERVRGDR